MAIGVTSNNGATPEPALSQAVVAKLLVQPLTQASQFLASGVTVIDSPGGVPVRLPKQAPALDPLAFVGENQLVPEVSPQFSEVDLLPSTMPSVKVLVKFSNELARQSVISLDAALQQRLVSDVASTLDAAMIAGNGDSVTGIRGLINFPGVQTLDVGSGAFNYDSVLAAYGQALGAFVDPTRLRWMMRSETYLALASIKAGTGLNTYAGSGSPVNAPTPSLFGIPVTVTNRIPVTGTGSTKKTKAVLADFSQIAVARDLAPSVKLLDQTFGNYDQLALRVVARYDVKPLNEAAIIRVDNVPVA